MRKAAAPVARHPEYYLLFCKTLGTGGVKIKQWQEGQAGASLARLRCARARNRTPAVCTPFDDTEVECIHLPYRRRSWDLPV